MLITKRQLIKDLRKYNGQKGQVMLFTTMIFVGAILTIGVFVGLLVIFGFAQSTNIPLSSDAIFAADAGIECVINRKFGIVDEDSCPAEGKEVVLDNGAKFTYRALDANTWLALGKDKKGKTVRALQIKFKMVE